MFNGFGLVHPTPVNWHLDRSLAGQHCSRAVVQWAADQFDFVDVVGMFMILLMAARLHLTRANSE